MAAVAARDEGDPSCRGGLRAPAIARAERAMVAKRNERERDLDQRVAARPVEEAQRHQRAVVEDARDRAAGSTERGITGIPSAAASSTIAAASAGSPGGSTIRRRGAELAEVALEPLARVDRRTHPARAAHAGT